VGKMGVGGVILENFSEISLDSSFPNSSKRAYLAIIGPTWRYFKNLFSLGTGAFQEGLEGVLIPPKGLRLPPCFALRKFNRGFPSF